jgi:hypothetical protein
MDSVPYSSRWGGTGGFSLERIELTGPSTEQANWGTSGSDSGSTPGGQNFLTPLDTNIRATRLTVAAASDSSALLALSFRNIGRTPVREYTAAVYLDVNGDTTATEDELLATAQGGAPIQPGDSATVLLRWDHPSSGEEPLIGVVTAEHDMRAADDRIRRAISFAFRVRSLVVNEIMYEPAAGRSEYVELLNASKLPVDLQEWKLSSRRDSGSPTATGLLLRTALPILPGEFVVVAPDSGILADYAGILASGSHLVALHRPLGLGNQGDTLILLDLTGRTIDSVVYTPSWHNPDLEETRGRSLERINPLLPGNDPRSWSTSADPSGGTPGRRNSLFTPESPLKSSLSLSPNPFSPDGDAVDDAVMIGYVLPFASGTMRIGIYDAQGRLIRRLAEGEPTGRTGQIVWDGYTDRKERASIGIYIVLVEAHDAAGTATDPLKGIVVVAARL